MFKKCPALFLVALVSISCAPIAKTQQDPHQLTNLMSAEEVREGYIRNAAITQLYRWYQFYENDEIPIENQIDILSPDIYLKSALGEGTGHDTYRQRVAQIPVEWDNAHDIKSSEITINDDGTIDMLVNIRYTNRGALPDGGVRTADLSYTTALAPSDTVLPKFTKIVIEQNSENTADAFDSIYAENRLRGLLHYWFAIIEDPSRDPEPAKDIFADEFELNFSSDKIETFEQFEAWLKGPGSSVAASTHTISAFAFETLADNSYKLMSDFDWQGITPDGAELIAKTRHTWMVEDDPRDRFARMKTVDVEVLIPFQPRSE